MNAKHNNTEVIGNSSMSAIERPAKKTRVDDTQLMLPPIPVDSMGSISNPSMCHTHVMRICQNDLLATIQVINQQWMSPQRSPLLQMTTSGMRQPQQQNFTSQVERNVITNGTPGVHLRTNGSFSTDTNYITSIDRNRSTVIQSQTMSSHRPTNGIIEPSSNVNRYMDREIDCDLLLSAARTIVSASSYPSNIHMRRTATIRNVTTSHGPSIPRALSFCLAQPVDEYRLSEHQIFLRMQIEAFTATEDDVNTHIRGRNKRVMLGQVGIRCRHCAHVAAPRRQKGTTYFPANTMRLYQAAQNMSTEHIQCGLCTEMPEYIKEHFKGLIATKSFTSGAGRPYWAKSAKSMGLVDTEDGIRFISDVPEGAIIIDDCESAKKPTSSSQI